MPSTSCATAEPAASMGSRRAACGGGRIRGRRVRSPGRRSGPRHGARPPVVLDRGLAGLTRRQLGVPIQRLVSRAAISDTDGRAGIRIGTRWRELVRQPHFVT